MPNETLGLKEALCWWEMFVYEGEENRLEAESFSPLPRFWHQQFWGGRLCLMWRSLLAPSLGGGRATSGSSAGAWSCWLH